MAHDPIPVHESPILALRIRHYDFTITRRYYSGQTITAPEAYALNQMLAENVRNNVEHWIRKAERQSPAGFLTEQQQSDLQTRISGYADKYKFQSRGRHRPLSPIDLALSELADSIAVAEGSHQGLPPDDPAVRLRYRQLLTSPELQARARILASERAREADDALSDILEAS